MTKQIPQLPELIKLPQVGNLPKIAAVPTLPRLPSYNAQAIARTRQKQQLEAEQARQQALKNASYKQLTGIKDVNDPYVINSLADAFNRAGKEKRYGSIAESLHNIPVIGDLITSAIAVTDTEIISPWANLLTGNFKAYGINRLTNFSETMDVLANPVKSVITPLVNQDTSDPKYQLSAMERISSSLGFSEHGRYNYDYDTGFWLSDIGLEIISDPEMYINIATTVAWGGVGGFVSALKQLQKEGVELTAEAIMKTGVKVLNRTGKEVSQIVLRQFTQWALNYKTVAQVVKRTVELKKLGKSILRATIKIAKNTSDDALQQLVEGLAKALKASKGFLNSDAKSIIDSIASHIDAMPKELRQQAIDGITELLPLLDTFKNSKFSLLDLLKAAGWKTSADVKKTLTKEAAEKAKDIRKAIKSTTDVNELKRLNEALEMLLSDPVSIQKYGGLLKRWHLGGVENVEEVLAQIDLTDYLEAVNNWMQNSKIFALMRAMDALTEATEAVNNRLMKVALMSGPIGQAFFVVTKTSGFSKFKQFTTNWMLKRLSDVNAYYLKQTRQAAGMALRYDEMRAVYDKVIKEFNVLSEYTFDDSSFDKELAKYVYDDTLMWLKGQAAAERYVPKKVTNEAGEEELVYKPVNLLLATPKELETNIWEMHKADFRKLGVRKKDAVNYFFEQHRLRGAQFRQAGYNDMDILEYINALRIPEIYRKVQENAASFNELLKKSKKALGQKGGVLKYLSDYDVTNRSKITSNFTENVEVYFKVYLDNFAQEDSSLLSALKKDLEVTGVTVATDDNSAVKLLSNQLAEYRTLTSEIKVISESIEEAQKLTDANKALRGTEAARQNEIAIAKASEQMSDKLYSLRMLSTNILERYRFLSKAPNFEKTQIFTFLDNIKKTASPYFGLSKHGYKLNEVRYALEVNTFYKNLEILKDPNFTALINSLRPGNPGASILNTARMQAQTEINKAFRKGLRGKELEYATKQAKQTIQAVTRVEELINSIDAYVDHLSYVKQSGIPEELQNIYFQVLQEYEVRRATDFKHNFSYHSSEIIRRINERLTGLHSPHTYNLDYFASKLLKNKDYNAAAQKFLESSRSALDEAEFIETLFKANILPELQKTKDVLNTQGDAVAQQYVHSLYRRHANRKYVYVNLKTSGDNAVFDSVTEFAMHSPDDKLQWHRAVNAENDEVHTLLDLYEQLKAVKEADKELTIISAGSYATDAYFLQLRYLDAMEALNTSGDPKLFLEYRNAIFRNTEADKAALPKLWEALQDSIPEENKELFVKLAEAQHWMHLNYTASNLDIVDLMKKFEGIPTVGEYSWDIRRFLFTHIYRQTSNNGFINLILNDNVLDLIRNVPGLATKESQFRAYIDQLYHLFNEVAYWDSNLFAKGDSYALSGRYILDTSFYNREVYTPTIDPDDYIASQQIEVYDKTELLNLDNEGRWWHKGTQLPEEVTTANEAVRYLRTQNIEYAPQWKALSAQQQIASYPVMINGNISVIPLEGPQYITIKKYIDTALFSDFFKVVQPTGHSDFASYALQHDLTVMAQRMSDVISDIKNPRVVEELSDEIDAVFNAILEKVLSYENGYSIYQYLKPDLDVYHKYAVLVVLSKDENKGAPRRYLNLLLNKKAVEPQYKTVKDYIELGFPEEIQYKMLPPEAAAKRGIVAKGGKSKTDWFKQNSEYFEELKQEVYNKYNYEKYTEVDLSVEYPEAQPVVHELNKRLVATLERPEYTFRTKNVDESYADYQKYVAQMNQKRAEVRQSLLNELGITPGTPAWEDAIKYEKLRTKRYQETYGIEKQARAEWLKQIDQMYDEYAEEISKIFQEQYIEQYQKHQEFLKLKEADRLAEDTRVAEANAIIENATANARRVRLAKMVRQPYNYAGKHSSVYHIYNEFGASKSLNYTDNVILQSEYSTHLTNLEKYTSVEHARNLQAAILEANEDVLRSTKAFKGTMDKHKIYAPSLQRHAVLGKTQLDLNNYKLQLINKYNENEFEILVSCDKQIVNNLEDLLLLNVLDLNIKDLTSFVYHQGKGCVIIPAGAYLKDTTQHSYDVKTALSGFIKKYNGYQDEFITVQRSGDDLIIFANDYLFHMKQNKIAYKAMPDLDFRKAFESAFGYPGSDLDSILKDNAKTRQLVHSFVTAIEDIEKTYPKNSLEYTKAITSLMHTYKTNRHLSTKQMAFLFTHWEDIENLKQHYLKQHEHLKRLAVDYDHQYSQFIGGFGRVTTEADIIELHERLPASIRKRLYGANPLDQTTAMQFFTSPNSGIFNFSTLGRSEYRHGYEPFATSDYHKIMSDTYRGLSSGLSTVSQYAKFFDDDSPLSLNTFFNYATPEEMFIALKQTDDYTVSCFRVDKKGSPYIVDLEINSVEDLKKALDNNAILLPNLTHASIVQTINSKRWSNNPVVSKVIHKVTYYNKMFTLIANLPGFMFRNILDSTMKNVIVTQDTALMDDYINAFRYLSQYEETVNRFFQLSPDNPFKPTVMQEVFANKAVPLDEETFMLIHNFLENGPSAGPINSVSEFYLKNAAVEQPNMVQKFFDWAMQPTKQIEQITRLSMYLNFVKKNMTNTDAFRIITKTHFDYATKTTVAQLTEVIIPFFTFQTRNFVFWCEMLEKNPLLSKCFINLFTSQWNWEDIDFNRIQYYQSKLNHMLQSNIQLNDKGLTLKVNPSYMDPVSVMLNPIESISGRISPIAKIFTDALLENEPYNYEYGMGSTAGALTTTAGVAAGMTPVSLFGAGAGLASMTAQSYKSGSRAYQNTGSPLPLIAPSIFGSVKTPTQYGRASYTNSRAFRDPQKRVPRRVNIYNKLYTDTGKNRWQLRYLPIDNFTVQWRIRESTNLFR